MSNLNTTSLKRGTPVTGRMLIGGQLVEGSGGNWLESINPATGEVIGKVPRATAADVEGAVSAAEAAQVAWAELSVAQRSQHLSRLADALAARSEDLLMLEVADSGNTITGMKGDISGCIDRLRYFAGLGYELQGSTIPGSSNTLNLTIREPYGVVGRIVAFNHPIAMAVFGVASPLVAGNSVVLKPSEQCSLSATLLGEIASEVLPPGVLNIVTGDGEVGGALVRHPRVKRLSFVGSIRTGMAIQRSADLARAGRQESVHHLSRRAGREGRRGCGGRDELHLAGTVVQLDQPPVRPRRDLRRGGEAGGRQGRGNPHR